MGEMSVGAASELPQREGVELMALAGHDTAWSMPVALWHAPKGFDTRHRPDQQPCHVIALRLGGSLVQRVRDDARRTERLHPKGFSVHPPHCALRFIAPSAIRFAHLYASQSFLQDIAGSAAIARRDGHLDAHQSVMYQDADLSAAIEAYVQRAFDRADAPSRLEMESRANLIAIRFLKQHLARQAGEAPRTPGSELAPWQVKRICTHLEANLDRAVSLAELSVLLDLSEEHLCRAFKRATGLPPQRWAIRKRIEIACRLLAETDATLTSIAQDVGYAGQSAFGTAFRGAVGLSPGQYRRAQRHPADTEVGPSTQAAHVAGNDSTRRPPCIAS